jgi:transcription-repair coupling factor (superfamily II helicase)
LEDETARRFGRLPPAAREFFAAAKLRLDCKRRGIVRLDVGPEAVAATFLPGRLRRSRAMDRDGDRVVYIGNRNAKPFERISDFLELLDE